MGFAELFEVRQRVFAVGVWRMVSVKSLEKYSVYGTQERYCVYVQKE
jgi:hypothetical protein